MAVASIAGRYRCLRLLGRGGLAEVWLAEDTELERPVALKLLARRAEPQRFRREAHAVAALTHPNINRLYDYDEESDPPFLALEYLPGGSLEERLASRRALDDAETQQIARELAAALAYAHAHGIVHRDLKPANVLFDGEGSAKLTDFGVAMVADDSTFTEVGTVIGTATTISPEQAVGERATAASDVYSFGVVLHWMLTGRPPFESDRPLDLIELHRSAPPPEVGLVRPAAPAALAALAAACLAKERDARPQNGSALVRLLGSSGARCHPTAPASAPPAGGPGALVPPPALVCLAVAGVAAALAVAWGGSAGPGGTSVPSLPSPARAPAGTAAAVRTTGAVDACDGDDRRHRHRYGAGDRRSAAGLDEREHEPVPGHRRRPRPPMRRRARPPRSTRPRRPTPRRPPPGPP